MSDLDVVRAKVDYICGSVKRLIVCGSELGEGEVDGYLRDLSDLYCKVYVLKGLCDNLGLHDCERLLTLRLDDLRVAFNGLCGGDVAGRGVMFHGVFGRLWDGVMGDRSCSGCGACVGCSDEERVMLSYILRGECW